MNQSEALQKINEIHKVIESSNTALFSGERMMMNGIMLLAIPLIELLSQGLTFGHDLGVESRAAIAIGHIVFYVLLFQALAKWGRFKKVSTDSQHPLIRKAFSLSRPLTVCIFGLSVVFCITGDFMLIHPMVFIFLGLMFSMYGRFSIPSVTYIAYSFIFVGLMCVYLKQYNIPNLWVYMLVYNGLAYTLMGYLLRRAQLAQVPGLSAA